MEAQATTHLGLYSDFLNEHAEPILQQEASESIRGSSPVDTFDVLVGVNSQLVAPAQSPALEHCASVSRCHALAKTMHAQAPPDFGLISSFRHLIRSSTTIDDYKSLGCNDSDRERTFRREARNYTVKVWIRSI